MHISVRMRGYLEKHLSSPQGVPGLKKRLGNPWSIAGVCQCVPAYGHCHGLGGGSTGTDDLRLQPMRLEHTQEGIA